MKTVLFVLLVHMLVLFLAAKKEIIFKISNSTNLTSGYCYEAERGIGPMKMYEYKTVIGHCIWAICDKDRSIYYGGCGKWEIPPSCSLVPEDLTKPYPDCCPYIDCS